MHYELSTDCGRGAQALWLRERRGPGGGYRRDFYAEDDDGSGTHPVSAEAERRVRRAGDGRERFRRMLALSEYLAGSSLPEAARNAWLDLEELLHAHWHEIAVEHYNQGVTSGLARAEADARAARDLPAGERIRALAKALLEAAGEL